MSFGEKIKTFFSKERRKKWFRIGVKTSIICFLSLCLFECSFRFQVVEFYGSELSGLNSERELNSKGGLLIYGDSFTAHTESYVHYLREQHQELSIVNTAIPGSGIRQHNLIAEDRAETFSPSHIIYQFYVGNDLSDIAHTTNYNEISFVRNIYWKVSDYFLSLHYLNYKLAFLKSNPKGQEIRHDEFDAERYNNREKTYFRASPRALNNTIFLKDYEQELMQDWKAYFDVFLEEVQTKKVSLIVLPHCAQVSANYQKRMEQIGAEFSGNVQEVNYPLVEFLQETYPNINVINPLEFLQQEEAGGKQLYYSNDPHLNTSGQEALANYLSSLNLLPLSQ